jgi:Holliday junction resolvase
MSRKSKGINAERELIHLFWNHGWACIRVAGSGASRYPTPDIVAGNKNRVLAIECKASKGQYQYLENEEIGNLRRFSELFGAEAWVGVRFNNADWQFFRIEDLGRTKSNYVVTRETRGTSFEILLTQTTM